MNSCHSPVINDQGITSCVEFICHPSNRPLRNVNSRLLHALLDMQSVTYKFISRHVCIYFLVWGDVVAQVSIAVTWILARPIGVVCMIFPCLCGFSLGMACMSNTLLSNTSWKINFYGLVL